MYIAVIRWLIFLFIGLPLHWLLMSVYVIVYLLWRLFFIPVKRKGTYQQTTDAWFYNWASDSRYISPIFDIDRSILLNSDDHNLFTQFTVAKPHSFKLFTYRDSDGFLNFTRTPQLTQGIMPDMKEVSGDCVISFCFAATIDNKNLNSPEVKSLVLDLAKTYLTFLGSRSFDKKNNGHVSARCNNFGVNWCPDGFLQIGQPSFGPNYFTSSALFALASHYSLFWKIVYHIHRIIMGGFIFEWMPLVVPTKSLYYVRDMTAKAIFVHHQVLGNKKWMQHCFSVINKSSAYFHPMFQIFDNPKLISDETINKVSDVMPRFFEQRDPGSNFYDETFIPGIKSFLIKLKRVMENNHE